MAKAAKSKIVIPIIILIFIFCVALVYTFEYYSNSILLIDGMINDLMFNIEESEPYSKWISEEDMRTLDFFPEEYADKDFSVRSDFSTNIIKKVTLKTLTVKRKENVSFTFYDGTEYSYKGTFLITTEYNGEYWNITGVTLDNN